MCMYSIVLQYIYITLGILGYEHTLSASTMSKLTAEDPLLPPNSTDPPWSLNTQTMAVSKIAKSQTMAISKQAQILFTAKSPLPKFQPATATADGKAIDSSSLGIPLENATFEDDDPSIASKTMFKESVCNIESTNIATNTPSMTSNSPMNYDTTDNETPLMTMESRGIDFWQDSQIVYGTNSISESGILDEIDDILQEENDILFWEQEELLEQEMENEMY